ncbi:MAG: hypothetical protein HOP31_15100 [Ignavibacteria bacterium]|nr:hypothetical protein [Ignavibacteria bacterium]
MDKLKIIQILKTFSKPEFREFQRFAASPYFNGGRNYVTLLKVLKHYYPDFSSAKFSKENVYSKLFPGKEFKDTVLKTMFSGLNSLAEDFLAQKMFDTNKFEVLHAKLNAYHNRNLEKQFSDTIKAAYDKFHELEIVDPLDALRNKYELSLIEATFYNGRRNLNIKNKEFDVTTSVATLFFMEYFVTYADEVAKSNAINQPMPEIIDVIHNNVNFDEIISCLIESNPGESYKISFYYNLYKARRFRDKKFYFEAKTIFFNNLQVIPKPTKQSFIFLLMNCLTYILKSSKDEKIEKERYVMIKFMFENSLHIFPGDEILPLGSFKNALTLSISYNDLEFTNELLENHINFLHKDLIRPYKEYGYSLLAFKRSDFKHSLELLQKIDLSEYSLKLDIRILSSKLYFELGYWESAFTIIESFRKFLSENINISLSLKEQILSFIKFYSEILKIRTGNRKDELEYLKKNLEKEHITEGYNWLMEKITEIENQ